MSDMTMYIFVNNSLKMDKGKIASQVGHVVQTITDELVTKSFSSKKNSIDCHNYNLWNKTGSKKIILKATTEQLQQLKTLQNSRYIIDAGKTQIENGSLTVVGFFPCDNLGEKFKYYKLL